MNKEKELINEITYSLDKANIKYSTMASIRGIQQDIVIESQDGRLIVIDIKLWDKKEGIINRAANQVKLYQEEVGVDRAFIVVEDLKKGRPSEVFLHQSNYFQY